MGFLKEKLPSKLRIPGKKETWKEEETENKVKVPSVRFWKWRNVQGIRELHGKECQGMLRGSMHKAQAL